MVVVYNCFITQYMLTFTEYLQESLLMEARRDIRQNPPEFTRAQIITNNKLLQDLGYVIRQALLKSNKFGEKVGFSPAYNVKGNLSYRNVIELATREYGYGIVKYSTSVELVTDSVKGIVSIISTNKEENNIVDTVYKEIEKRLKVIAKTFKRTKLDSGRQYGYHWKLEELDYSKCEKHPEIRSVRPAEHQRQAWRKRDERHDRDQQERSAEFIKKTFTDSVKKTQENSKQYKSTKIYKTIESIGEKCNLYPTGLYRSFLGYYIGPENDGVGVGMRFHMRDQETGRIYRVEGGLQTGSNWKKEEYAQLLKLIKPSDQINKIFKVCKELGITFRRGENYSWTANPNKLDVKINSYVDMQDNKSKYFDLKGSYKKVGKLPSNVQKFIDQLEIAVGKLKFEDFPKVSEKAFDRMPY